MSIKPFKLLINQISQIISLANCPTKIQSLAAQILWISCFATLSKLNTKGSISAWSEFSWRVEGQRLGERHPSWNNLEAQLADCEFLFLIIPMNDSHYPIPIPKFWAKSWRVDKRKRGNWRPSWNSFKVQLTWILVPDHCRLIGLHSTRTFVVFAQSLLLVIHITADCTDGPAHHEDFFIPSGYRSSYRKLIFITRPWTHVAPNSLVSV